MELLLGWENLKVVSKCYSTFISFKTKLLFLFLRGTPISIYYKWVMSLLKIDKNKRKGTITMENIQKIPECQSFNDI